MSGLCGVFDSACGGKDLIAADLVVPFKAGEELYAYLGSQGGSGKIVSIDQEALDTALSKTNANIVNLKNIDSDEATQSLQNQISEDAVKYYPTALGQVNRLRQDKWNEGPLPNELSGFDDLEVLQIQDAFRTLTSNSLGLMIHKERAAGGDDIEPMEYLHGEIFDTVGRLEMSKNLLHFSRDFAVKFNEFQQEHNEPVTQPNITPPGMLQQFLKPEPLPEA
ncbi:MAG: hypothetical protein DHS20C02_03060 [Micavibrio sp.]|nr:MAG: hypothetical protein DHS20C02_03060 [Micavibrio sp.]